MSIPVLLLGTMLRSEGEISPVLTQVFAIIPIYFYNGEKGRGDKNFFYIFYPVHIYILYIVASLLH